MTKILVVDDNEPNLYILKVLLESHGYEYAMAYNGIEALEKAQTDKPDLVISDILMPGMDGFSLCRQWKTDDQFKAIPFIFYTATYTDAKDEDFALSLGAERFVRKPAEPDQFIEIVNEVLSQYKKGELVKSPKVIEKEDVYFKKYNETLIRKMEDKMLELEKANQRLSALFQTSVELTSLTPKGDFIKHILSEVIRVINCTHANYFEFNENKNEFQLQAVVGFAEKDLLKYQHELVFHLGEARGLVGLVGQNQKPLILNDTYSDPRWIKADKSVKSALFLPMVCENHLIGVLSFLCTDVNRFDEKISRDMVTLANNLAIAIEKTRFYEKIKQSENRYRTLVETSIDAIVSINSDGLITDWSRGAEVVFGFSKDEQIGKALEVLVPNQNKQKILDGLEEVNKKGYKSNWESQFLTKEGRLVDVEMTFTFLGKELGYTTILRDVTKQKQAEKALRESEKFLNNIIENIPNMIFVKDANKLQFIRFNKAGEDLLGYSKKEMYGKSDFDFFPKDEADIFFQHDQDALKNNQSVDIPVEIILTRNKGERILHTKKIPILDEQGNPKYLLGISEDITNRMRSEQLLNALNQVAVAMASALTPEDIFKIVAIELNKLSLSCMLFPIDNINTKMLTTYLSYEPPVTNKSENSNNFNQEIFQIPINAIDIFDRAIQEGVSIYSEDTEKILKQVFPKFAKKVSSKFAKQMKVSKIIISPLIAEEKVIGIFSVQSKSLTREDTPAVTAFANQLAAAWNKAKLTTKLQQTMNGVIHTIASIVEMRDPYTAGHQKRVSELAAAIARAMNLSNEQIESVRIAGIIHDLGKIYVPAEILSKPGKLSEIEYNLVKTHPQVGYDLLKTIEFPWPLAQTVFQHHERMDGSGYPQGLKGDNILLEARIITVADIVEAMSSHRPYRPALGLEAAKEEIIKNKGVWYDPSVVDACLQVLDTGYKLLTD